jgi:hypothetical protein
MHAIWGGGYMHASFMSTFVRFSCFVLPHIHCMKQNKAFDIVGTSKRSHNQGRSKQQGGHKAGGLG